MPPPPGPPSAPLCIFCQLRASRNGMRYLDGIHATLSTRGTRPIHTGSPSRVPPPEPQPQPSPTPRSPWTSAAQPGYGKASEYAGIDKYLQYKKENPPQQSQGYKPSGDLGKWSKSSPLFDSIPDLINTQKKPDAIKTTSPFQAASQATAPPLKFSFLSPRPDSIPELSILDDAKRQTSAVLGKQQKKVSERTTSTPTPLYPYANVLKSKQSAKAIEDNLFDGIEAKPAPPPPPPPPPTISEIFSGVRMASASVRGTSYSEATQRFKVSESAMSVLANDLNVAEEKPAAAVPQLRFMAARNTVRPVDSPIKLKTESEPEPEQHPELIKSLPDGVMRVDSSSWQSSSREKWTYDIDVKAEAEAEAERILENDPRARMTPQEIEAASLEAAERKKDIERLIRKAKSMKFKVGFKDIGVWKGEYEKSRFEEVNEISVQKRVYIPESISVANLSNALKIPLETLQKKMELLGLEPEQCAFDYILDDEMASLIAPEFGFEPILDDNAGFDLYPQPLPEDTSKIPLRPPIVTIMGHVDHGKTTLLDTLRKTHVAASEAGGITQHIGAFSVSLPSGEKMTFLDTPGHAAFLTMRERGANVTDIVVLVVAADDSVMPQTLEAIAHAKAAKVPLIVAINKCDLVGVDVQRVKADLLSHQVELEEFGGDVQCVEVSAKTGLGLDKLEAAIVTLAEVLEMKAPATGMVEARVIESTIDAGRGTYATVLVKRGTLQTGDYIVAGTTYAKVRRMTTADGKSVKKAPPGTPVEVSGWKSLPEAGDLVLQASKESDAKLAIRNREAAEELERNLADVSAVNARRQEQRKELLTARQQKMVAAENKRSGMALPGIVRATERETGPKVLPVIIKADFGGSAEAVEEAIKNLGNSEVKVEILGTSVGEFTETDVMTAISANAKMVGFNIRAMNPSLRRKTNEKNIEVIYHSIIYKLIDDITSRLESMLAPMIETRVTGEAEVTQMFDITAGKKHEKKVGGCRVFNGIISRKEQCRVTRNGKIIFNGFLDTLRHFKDDVKEVRKDMECGLSFAEFKELKVGDLVQSFKEVTLKRKLY